VARARQEALAGLPGPGSGQTGSHRDGRVAVLGSGVRANRVAAIAVIAGMRKPGRATFSERDYKSVRELGGEHRRNYPRRIGMGPPGQAAGT